MICHYCQSEFTPKTAKPARYCSRRCNVSHADRQVRPVTCPKCGEVRLLTLWAARRAKLCRLCATDAISGSGNGNWRGGHRHWSPGRYGQDKDGLSWRTQRRLAWERDNYTCQGCGERKNRNPDAHHIVPYRVSQSHALDNLLCLCQSCHSKLETTVQEKWGGQLHPPAQRYRICECGRRCINEQCGECRKGEARRVSNSQRRNDGPYSKSTEDARKQRVAELRVQKEQLLPLVQQYHSEGLSLAQIAALLPIKLHRQTIYHWLKWGSVHHSSRRSAL